MSFQLILTDAGKAAIAQVGQVGPVKITKIALGSAGYTPAATQTSLKSEIKQLPAKGNTASGPGIMHITAQDSSEEGYIVREIAIITEDGTLFAVYAQNEDILIKGAGSHALWAFDFAITNVPPESITIGNAEFQYPPASESTKGVAKIATQEEVSAGSDDNSIATPAKISKSYVKRSGDAMTGPLINSRGFIGNASSATRLQTKRTIALGGEIRGQAEFDGTDNITIETHSTRLVPPGAVCAFAAITPPVGWLKASGAAVSRTAYSALYATIGNLYGAGDNSTTFNLPDLRGLFVRGWDDGRGINRGRRFGSWEADEFRSHTHRFIDDPTGGRSAGASGAYNRVRTLATDGGLVHSNLWAGWIAHSGGAETRPTNVALLYCIKY